jgi:hypothetical protein
MGDFRMRKILLVAMMTIACEAAHAQGMSNFQLAQATSAAPAEQAALAAPAPQAAAPDATAQPAAAPSKPAKKKRQAGRRETDEEKARRIAAKYGVSW